ncbi:MAG: type I-E CRISPR-associated protein Cse1/CasA, partial [Bradymonadaceae bacterium]
SCSPGATRWLWSLLDDPLIRVRTSDDTVEDMSLPQIYEALWEEQVHSFEALQAHQRQPWFSFLVQVAAMATARAGRDEPPSEAATWRELLVGLADGSKDAWHLVVEDVERPAFMQPPVPEGSLEKAGYSDDVPTPDVLDMLIASKTHDIKYRRMNSPRPEHWVFALLTLQTLEGYSGAKNYGIVRMNGGLGNRPLLGLTPELDWGARFRRDTHLLLDSRSNIADTYSLDPDGHTLLWLDPWDGAKESAIPLTNCDPYFVEICRRLRFTDSQQNGLTCWRNTTSGQRLQAPDSLNGRTGDPWTPIDIDNEKALTLGENGFTYEQLQQIWLSNKFERPPALTFQRDDPESAQLIATTLVRGQGKTQGFHRRIIPVPQEVSEVMGGSDSDRNKLAERAQTRVKLAGEVQSQVLRAPIFTLVYDGRDPADPNWDKVNKWLDGYDQAVDNRFFDALWDSVVDGLSDPEAKAQWHRILRQIAEDAYDDIRDSIPIRSIHRYRILSDADSQFHGRLRSILDRAFDDNDDSNQEETDERPATA